jgi:hypothetical protein
MSSYRVYGRVPFSAFYPKVTKTVQSMGFRTPNIDQEILRRWYKDSKYKW